MQGSPTLSTKFEEMKSLHMQVRVFDSKGVAKTGEMKCQYNLEAAKSVLRFDCPNMECVGGDFDFTAVLDAAVTEHRTTATVELVCNGWRDKGVINTIHCDNRMRYKMSLAYGRARVHASKPIPQPAIPVPSA